jgi:hypothetical protein
METGKTCDELGAFYRPACWAKGPGGRQLLALVEFYFDRQFQRWNGGRGGNEAAPIQWGKWRRWGGGSVWLHVRTRGRPTVAHGAVAPGEAAAAQSEPRKDKTPQVGWLGPKIVGPKAGLGRLDAGWKHGKLERDGPELRIKIMGCRKIHSIFSQGFGFKTKDSNTFKSKFELRPN